LKGVVMVFKNQIFISCLLASSLVACSGGDKSSALENPNPAATPAASDSTMPTTTLPTTQTQTQTTPTTPGSTTTLPATTPTNAVAAPSLAVQIATLEASGKLPKLDRSSDIKGPDTNNNGIRDDIDAWIAAQPITEVQKKAAQQIAKVQQATTLVDLNDKAALQTLGDRTAAAVVCLSRVFAPDQQAGSDLGAKLEAISANTKERAMQYIKYNRASSGSTTSLPSGNTCEP
jgi:hypothetical protein